MVKRCVLARANRQRRYPGSGGGHGHSGRAEEACIAQRQPRATQINRASVSAQRSYRYTYSARLATWVNGQRRRSNGNCEVAYRFFVSDSSHRALTVAHSIGDGIHRYGAGRNIGSARAAARNRSAGCVSIRVARRRASIGGVIDDCCVAVLINIDWDCRVGNGYRQWRVIRVICTAGRADDRCGGLGVDNVNSRGNPAGYATKHRGIRRIHRDGFDVFPEVLVIVIGAV